MSTVSRALARFWWTCRVTLQMLAAKFSCTLGAELASGAHTLIIECSFPDSSPVPGHLTPRGVARIAREAGVQRVVLTHIFPPAEKVDLADEVGRGFDGEVIAAHDGLKLEV